MLSAKELIIAIPAFVGMGLGVYNLVRDISKDRVKLKVVPKSVYLMAEDIDGNIVLKTSPSSFELNEKSEYFAIEVINRGNIPVTIENVGFFARGKKGPMQVYRPKPVDNGEWPRRLESRQSVTVLGDLRNFMSSQNRSRVHTAYAETECGLIKRGTSKALKKMVKYEVNA